MTYDPISLRYRSKYCIQKCALQDMDIAKTRAVFYYVDSEAQAQMIPQHLTQLRVERGLGKPIFVLAQASLRPLLYSYQQELHPILYWPLRTEKVDRLLSASEVGEGNQ